MSVRVEPHAATACTPMHTHTRTQPHTHQTHATHTHTRTHVRRYMDLLVGPYPAAKAVYEQRSPIHHVDQISVPVAIMQVRVCVYTHVRVSLRVQLSTQGMQAAGAAQLVLAGCMVCAGQPSVCQCAARRKPLTTGSVMCMYMCMPCSAGR